MRNLDFYSGLGFGTADRKCLLMPLQTSSDVSFKIRFSFTEVKTLLLFFEEKTKTYGIVFTMYNERTVPILIFYTSGVHRIHPGFLGVGGDSHITVTGVIVGNFEKNPYKRYQNFLLWADASNSKQCTIQCTSFHIFLAQYTKRYHQTMYL